MGYKRRFFDNLPLYARLFDEEKGVLALLCDRLIQPQLDDLEKKLRQQEFFYDPNHPLASPHLDWLGQFVALGAIDGQFLGIGINPNWSVEQKRKIIWRAWKYWQKKGTEEGVREAIALWLHWEKAHDEKRLLINYPFGEHPVATPPQWYGWGSEYSTGLTVQNRYDAYLLQKYPERQHLGGGGYPGTRHQPNYFTLQQPHWAWDYQVCWSDRQLAHVESLFYEEKYSHLGPKNIWFHAYLKELDWNQIFPDIFELLDEALAVNVIPTVFGWFEGLRKIQPLSLTESDQSVEVRSVREFVVEGAQYGDLVGSKESYTQSDFLRGGTLWYYSPAPPSIITTTVEEKSWFGFWSPEDWYGMWWGTAIGKAAVDFSDTVKIETIEIEAITLPAVDLPIIDIDGVKELGLAITPWWYAPWGHYTTIRNLEIEVSGTECVPGIDIEVARYNLPALDFGSELGAVTNQLLIDRAINPVTGWIPSEVEESFEPVQEIIIPIEPGWDSGDYDPSESEIDWADAETGGEVPPVGWTPGGIDMGDTWNRAAIDPAPLPVDPVFDPGFVGSEFSEDELQLKEPIRVATQYHSLDLGYPWIVSQGVDVSPLAEAIAVPAIAALPLVEMGYIDAEIGQLCNCFEGWSSGGARYRDRKEPALVNRERGLGDIYPVVAIACDANKWVLLIETDLELYVLHPVTIFWEKPLTKERSTEFSFDFCDLYLEFLFQPKEDNYIRSATLWLGDRHEYRVEHQTYYYQLNAPEKAQIGFKFTIPFRLPSGLDSPTDELAVEELLPLLEKQLVQLEQRIVPTPKLSSNPVVIPQTRNPVVDDGDDSFVLPQTPVVQSLHNVLFGLSDRLNRLEQIGNDLHFSYRIDTPTTQARIQHNFGRFNKQPSVTVNCDKFDVEATVGRFDDNTVDIEFSEPTTAWVYFN